MNYKKVLVTGGTGFLGKNLQIYKPEWIYAGTKTLDLLDYKNTENYLKYHKPDAIVHLAARVGGIKENSENQADFFYKNVAINTNLLEAAKNCKIKRVLSSLSTCAFPDKLQKYPFSEEDLYLGPPAITNFSYGYTKRMLQVSSIAYRKQYNLNYSTFAPTNIFGPHDHFGKQSSHFVAAILYKAKRAKPNAQIELWGTGKPLRQQLFVKDLCSIIPELLEIHDTQTPVIVAPNENTSILSISKMVNQISGKNLKFYFNGKLDGQYRKDGRNTRFKNLMPEFKFTPLQKALKLTYDSINLEEL